MFGDFPQMEEVARIWDLVMQQFTFTGGAMSWPVFVAELLAVKGRCVAGDFVIPGDKFSPYDWLDDHSEWAKEEHAANEAAEIRADQLVQRQADYNTMVDGYNRAAAAYNAALTADPRPDPLPGVPARPTLEGTPITAPARAATALPAFSPVTTWGPPVARFAELRVVGTPPGKGRRLCRSG